MCRTVCGSGQTNCSNVCRDLQSDVSNCGTCGNVCPGGQVCSAGACTVVCTGGLTNCSNVCVNTQTSNTNCGTCGNACTGGATCMSGVCRSTSCGNNVVEPGEERDPPPGPFSTAPVNSTTCRWNFANVNQLYCNGSCTWAGADSCDQADADILCQLRTGNPNSRATSWTNATAQATAGFSCPLGSYGTNIGTLPLRGVNRAVWYQDTSILANHGAGAIILNPVCTNP
jgi:hypothetical protein